MVILNKLVVVVEIPSTPSGTANNTLPQELENHCATSSSSWIILLATVLLVLQTLYLGTRLALLSLSQAFQLSNIWTYALTEKSFEHIIQTSVKFSKNPPGKKTLHNCFIHKSSTGSGKRNEQKSYYSPPLVGKSHEEGTITTQFALEEIKTHSIGW